MAKMLPFRSISIQHFRRMLPLQQGAMLLFGSSCAFGESEAESLHRSVVLGALCVPRTVRRATPPLPALCRHLTTLDGGGGMEQP